MSAAHRTRVLALYRNIFRMHQRVLSPEMRFMGDGYVRDEFKRHKNATPAQTKMFLIEWRDYLRTLRKQPRDVGRDLGGTELVKLSEEQRYQLSLLKNETEQL